jgi:Fe-S-cluster containining protein
MDYRDDLNYRDGELESFDKLVKRLKKKRPKNLYSIFNDAHDSTFETIDCLKCANCCKTTSPIFRNVDIQRISKKFKVSAREFENQYLMVDSDGDWVLKTAPCAFLQEDNTCFIYDIRPQACREYPHTNRKRMTQILELTRANMEVCPAVSRIFKDVQKEYQ